MLKVAIIGSGLNGLAVAFGLKKFGIDVTIFEDKTFGGNFANDNRTSFISHKSLNFFEEIGEKIKKKSGIIEHIYSFKNDKEFISEIGGENMGFVVENSFLKKNLIEYIQDSQVKIYENCPVESLVNTNNGVEINGEYFSCAICASGSNSNIHKILGIKHKEIQYNQTAFVFDIKHEISHKNIAIEAFDEKCIIAVLPKFDEKSSSVILSIKNEFANNLNNEDDKNILNFFKEKSKRIRHIGNIEEISSKICKYPLSMKFLTNQVFGKTIFIGDSFHAIHPVLGQGFNMSLKDTQNLCDYLAKMEKFGIQNINFKSITFNNLLNHFKIGLASHIFSTAFISQNKIHDTLSTASIAISQTIPVNLKTKILQKLL